MEKLERKQPVVFAGENHMITLYRSDHEESIAGISCWRCTYSEYGNGFTIALWCDPATVELPDLPPVAVFADNPAMGTMVMTRFNQQFDGRRLHRITCLADKWSIEMLWQDVLDASL